jgi:hypothetical protein
MESSKKSKVFFKIEDKNFVIEYTLFELNDLKCCHVEFGQRVGPFTAQFTMNNMSKHHALLVLRQVVRETEQQYSHYDMVVFTSLDGNIKRDAIYARIAKDMAKRQQCQLSYAQKGTHGKIFILHRGCYSKTINKDLVRYLSKNGLFAVGGKILTLYYGITNMFRRIIKFLS